MILDEGTTFLLFFLISFGVTSLAVIAAKIGSTRGW